MTATNAYLDGLAEWTKLHATLNVLSPQVESLGQAMLACWRAGGKIFFAGNGGSAADAMHFAEELTVRFQKDRRALAALALLDPAALTCCGNDFGFDHIFARQIDALGKPGDLLVVISTSGSSPNILRAVEMARKVGVKTFLLSGKQGGQLAGVCDGQLIVPSQTTARIQEVHKLVFHSLCVWIDSIAHEI